MVFTDPPYNVPISGNVCGLGNVQHRDFVMASGEMTEAQFSEFLEKNFRLLVQNSKDGSIHFIVWTGGTFTKSSPPAAMSTPNSRGFWRSWNKSNGGMGGFIARSTN